ncbi:MAG: GWxTD domain-containing protein [bacterium]|nr:GWxTD domain-containing protein [bacterium]
MRYTLTHSLYLLLVILVASCTTKKNVPVSKPTRSESNPESDLLEVRTVPYHLNDSVTRTYVEIKNNNLLYKRPDTSLAFYSEIRISYRLSSEQNPKAITDSASYSVFDRSENEKTLPVPILTKFDIKAHLHNNYQLQLDFWDVNRKTVYHKSIRIIKENRYSSQNFLVRINDSIAFRNSFLKGSQVKVKFTNSKVERVSVDCFFSDFGPAAPPFSTRPADPLKYKPDSTFELELSNNQFMLTMPERGFYHIKADPVSYNGISLYTVDETFPGVGNSLEMINCTRYIMFKEEYDACRNAEDKKGAIDAFWLDKGGSKERARELLKQYYGRVKEANKSYSSYTQGWKSDRGMIYIVFGPPSTIYRGMRDEVWIYGNDLNATVLRFVFNKTQNPFTENDFVLERSPYYKESYYAAVEYWRQGLIYEGGRR